jgi:hypothetical protein
MKKLAVAFSTVLQTRLKTRYTNTDGILFRPEYRLITAKTQDSHLVSVTKERRLKI